MSPSSVHAKIRADGCNLEALLNRFEDAWSSGAPPVLEEFMSQVGDAGRAELLDELVKIDLDYRWRGVVRSAAAKPCILEDYLARFPELAGRDPLALLVWEYRARHRWGDRPGHEEYSRRFGEHATRLDEALTRVDADLVREFSSTRKLTSRRATEPRPAAQQPVQLTPAVSELVEVLQQSALLSDEQLRALTNEPLDRWSTAAEFVAELQRRAWLTAFQGELLLAGRGRDLALGPYLLLERLGAGGVGQVFRARDRDQQRMVALKLIRPELLQDQEVLRRFYREAHIVGQLDHPNLVKGHASGPVGDVHCLVMEYVQGMDLAALVRESGPLSVARACDHVRQAALGLQHAHERGLVHRDIKPPNLLVVGDSGQDSSSLAPCVKILDLGLARLRPSVEGDVTGMVTAGQGTSLLTPAGALMIGTPDYLAPEQALDFHAADIRSDIYSLGCTFFFLLTGQPPFPGGTLAQKLLWHQQSEPPDIEKLRPDVPTELALVLRRMLAKLPEDRFQTPGAVADALASPAYQKLAQAPPTALPPIPAPGPAQATIAALRIAPPRWKRARVLIPALVLACGLAMLAYSIWPRFDRMPRPAATTPMTESSGLELLPPPHTDDLAEAWAALQALVAEPQADPEDMRRSILALRARFPGTPQAQQAGALLVRLPSPLDRLDATQIPPAERLARQPPELVAVLGERRNQNWGDIFRLTFSPDGKTLACGASSDKTVRLWDLSGTQPRRAKVIPGYSYITNALVFAPDGQSLSFIGDGCIVRRWDLANGGQQPWAVVLGPSSNTVVSAVAFAADGKALAYGGEDRTIHLWDLASTESKERAVLRGSGGIIAALAFAPDGLTLASGGADRLVRIWDLTATPPQERAAFKGHTQRVQGLAFAPDGRTVASCANDSTVRVWNLAPGAAREAALLRASNCNFVSVALSADGRRLAACASGGIVVWWDLQTGKKGGEFQFTPGVWNVAFAPDGRHLATGNGDGTIYILRVADKSEAPDR